jgi:hypothetical protein
MVRRRWGLTWCKSTFVGRLLHTVAVPSRPGMSPALDLAVDEHSGRVFAVAPDAGLVRVLDGWSGRVLRTVHLGSALDDIAVDSRRGRLIVTIPGDDNRAAASTAPGRVAVLDERTGARIQHAQRAGWRKVARAAEDGARGDENAASVSHGVRSGDGSSLRGP